MLLDVPLIPDREYAAFLADRADTLCSVHFSLASPHVQDARQRFATIDPARLIRILNTLPDVDRYVLMNSRLHAPERYFDAKGLDRIARLFEQLADKAEVRGVIFADAYILNALSGHCPDVTAQLEAVPSINCQLDSPDKIFAILDMIERTAFRLPSRLVLDRSLNRNLKRLRSLAEQMRAAYPGIKLLLMANEGCLYQCPFKSAHNAHISLVNEGLCGDRTFAVNREFGCIEKMLSDPGSMLASPFIRPEDQNLYEPLIDGIKLCGRNRGTAFLKRVITAYVNREYPDNLLDLMDTMGDLADKVSIPNQSLPHGFAERVTGCDKHCAVCGWCAQVMETVSARTDPGLQNFVP